MSDKTELKVETKESVALELAYDIANKESMREKSSDYRKDFLDLYGECLFTTNGNRRWNTK